MVVTKKFECPQCRKESWGKKTGNFHVPAYANHPWCDWMCIDCNTAFEMKSVKNRRYTLDIHAGSDDNLLMNHIALAHRDITKETITDIARFKKILHRNHTFVVIVERNLQNTENPQKISYWTIPISECWRNRNEK